MSKYMDHGSFNKRSKNDWGGICFMSIRLCISINLYLIINVIPHESHIHVKNHIYTLKAKAYINWGLIYWAEKYQLYIKTKRNEKMSLNSKLVYKHYKGPNKLHN